MKKTTLIVALATVMLFAFASAAFANTQSGYKSWTGADVIAANAGTPDTPHKGYTSSTIKCSVCHAVHKASAEVGAETLLPTSEANSCVYCHISTPIGGKQIYNADVSAYSGGDNVYAHNPGGAACTRCHSVHGANTWGGAVESKILRKTRTDGGQPQAAAAAKWDESSSRDELVSLFCTNCHWYFTESSTTVVPPRTGTTSYRMHPMVPAGSTSVASSETCRSCHDAGEVDSAPGIIESSYPHYTPGAARFLLGAESADEVATGVGSNPAVDGACLKCHRTETSGVGITF